MKKGFLFAYVLFSLLTVSAQSSKPSKEETQRFINATLAKVVGKTELTYFTIYKQAFSESFDKFTYVLRDIKDITYFDSEETSLIRMEDIEDVYIKDHRDNEDLKYVILDFKSKLQNTSMSTGFKPKTEITSTLLHLNVPKDKAESIKKAFLRLKEIAQEENKDPFANR